MLSVYFVHRNLYKLLNNDVFDQRVTEMRLTYVGGYILQNMIRTNCLNSCIYHSNWLAPIEGYMIFKLIEPSYIQFHDDESMFVSKDIDIAQWYLIYFTIELTVFY